VVLGQGVNFGFLGAQDGALRALGLCNVSASLPWLVSGADGPDMSLVNVREWAAQRYGSRTVPRPKRPAASGALALAFSNGTGAQTKISGGTSSKFQEVEQWNFFHIPKCAGTSLIAALERQAKAHGIGTCNGHSQAEEECSKSDAGLIYGHQYYGLATQTQARNGWGSKYFTILRHPLTRVPSLYHYIRRSKHHHLHSLVRNQTLLDFLRFQSPSDRGTGPGETTNEMTRMLCGPRSGLDAQRCSSDRAWAVAKAKEHLLGSFAVVGLQECFPESVALIARTLPWASDLAGGMASRQRLNTRTGTRARSLSRRPPQSAQTERLAVEKKESAVVPPLISRVLSEVEMSAVLAQNEWDLEVFSFALHLFRAQLAMLAS